MSREIRQSLRAFEAWCQQLNWPGDPGSGLEVVAGGSLGSLASSWPRHPSAPVDKLEKAHDTVLH